jgi:hypothetical protein
MEKTYLALQPGARLYRLLKRLSAMCKSKKAPKSARPVVSLFVADGGSF